MSHRPDHISVCVEAERRAPKRRLGENASLSPEPIEALLVEKPDPAQRAQHLHIEAAQCMVEPVTRIGVPVKGPPNIPPRDPNLGFDIQHVQEDVPIA